MSRWKPLAIRSGVVLLVLGGTTMLWYQTRYARPLAAPMERVLPKGYSPSAPNGFDTLKEAIALLDDPKLARKKNATSYFGRQAEFERFIAVNQPFLAKTRQALGQPFLAPDPYPYDVYHFYHWDQLQWLSLAYASQGDFSEALRCALDLMELGALVPSGGEFHDRQNGYDYELQGRMLVWLLTERVDAKVAREAVVRLEKIEKRRWPLPENLREELRRKQVDSRLNAFQRGPIALWRSLSSDRSVRGKTGAKDLWEQVKTVTGGPQSFKDSWATWVERAQTRLEQPWNSARPALVANPEVDPITGAVSADLYGLSDYTKLELAEYLHRTDTALLRTYLMLRAYKREQGSYPDSLEGLVAKGYLAAVPIDPFSPTRAALRYRRDEGGETFTLWSVGPDTKDNDGETIQPEPGEAAYDKPEWVGKKGGEVQGDLVARRTFYPNNW